MDYRKDALMGLADFAHEIPRILEENGGENSRATIGKAEILPGAPNSVPGAVEFSLDFRDPSTDILTELSEAFPESIGRHFTPPEAEVRITTSRVVSNLSPPTNG